MKFQTLLFFIVLFFATSISAQPGYYRGFNPADLCKYVDGKNIFVGRIISTELVSNSALQKKILNDPAEASLKTTVSIEKVFSGHLKLGEQKQIFVKGWRFPKVDVGDEHIFVTEEVILNDSKVLSDIDWSNRLKNYNAEEKSIRFSQIEARINRFPKSPPLAGIVLQTDDIPKYSLELDLLYGYEYKNFKPVAGITVLAKSKSNDWIFKTKSDKKGKFIFSNLNDDTYEISIKLPKMFEQEVLRDNKYFYTFTVNKDSCGGPGRVLSIHKTRKE